MFKQEMTPAELTMASLRELYSSYGYQQYKVSKFESYDFYVKNKNFLESKRILTFTDTNGRLMALKPDVTLSIIKNTKPSSAISKVYYTENVYREPKDGDGFQEIMQTGLERIGNIDDYGMSEVLMLAERSLRTISENYVLDISHIGVLSGLLADEGLNDTQCSSIMDAFEAKNQQQLRFLCDQYGLSEHFCTTLCTLVNLYGPLDAMLDKVEELCLPDESQSAVCTLRRLSYLLNLSGCRNIRLDFSLINDMDYYNDIVFRGFISGISSGVLSGGRYDNLLIRMGRTQSAIGFAVYLDQLERYFAKKDEFDVDVLLTYTDDSDLATIIRTAMNLTSQGERISVQHTGLSEIRARKELLIDGTEVHGLD